MFHYLWWAPLLVATCILNGWLSHNCSLYQGKWFWMLFISLAICAPMWAIVARISKRLLFDAMLYDNLLFLAYAFTLMAVGAGSGLGHWYNWAGGGVVIVGSVLMRV